MVFRNFIRNLKVRLTKITKNIFLVRYNLFVMKKIVQVSNIKKKNIPISKAMKKNVPVSNIMTSNLVLLNLNDTLEKAEGLFKKHNIRHIPVVNNNVTEGILSYTDLLRISFADAVDEDADHVDSIVYDMFTLEQVMVKNVITVKATDTIYEVAQILAKENFHALPVEEEGKLVGIVTTTDLIKYLLEKY